MPEIGGVWYSDFAFEHMHRIAQQTLIDAPLGRDRALVNEAEVIHAFHDEFPGLTWTEPAEQGDDSA